MGMNVIEKGYRFDRFAWFIAAATCFGIVGIITLAIHAATDFYWSYSFHRFNDLLLTDRIPEARTYVQKLFERAPLIGFTSSSTQLPPRELKPFVDGVLETLIFFKENDFTVLDGQIKKLSAFRPILREFDLMKSQWNSVELFADNGKKTLERIEQLEKESRRLSEDLKRTSDQYGLLVRDVSELFSLRAVVETAKDATPPFYGGGVLSGLPVLHGVPDNLVSLEALRDALDQAGGKVNVSGENIADTFKEKLAAMQQIGSGLVEKFGQIEQGLNSTAHELQSSKTDLIRLRNGAEDALKNILTTVLSVTQK